VQFASVSDQWAQFSVAGPCARDTLRAIVDLPFDLANDAFPHMAAGECTVCGGVPARLYRLSFSGELAYEIGVPARYGAALAEVLMRAGEPHGIAPYGTEALAVMRSPSASHCPGPAHAKASESLPVWRGVGGSSSANSD